MQNENDNIAIWPSDFCVVGKKMWFFHGTLNALMEYDLEKDVLRYVASVEEEKMYKKMLYSKIFFYENKLYLIPGTAQKIAIYDLNKKNFKYIFLEEIVGEVKFQEAWQCGEFIYCFPIHVGEPIIKFNTVLDSIETRILLPEYVRKKYKKGYFNDICEISEEIIAGVIYPSNRYFVLKVKNDEFQVYECGDENEKYNTIVSDSKYIYLSSFDKSEIYKVEINGGKIIKIFSTNCQKYRLIGCNQDGILVDLTEEKENYILNLQDGNMEEVLEQPDVREENFYNYWYMYGVYHAYEHGQKVFYFNRFNNFLYIRFGKNYIKKELKLAREDVKKIIDRLLSETYEIYEENSILSVTQFIENIVNKKESVLVQRKENKGKRIFDFVRKIK